MPLENRTVVISGATSELGATLARDLAAQKANLALLSRSAETLEKLSHRLNLPTRQVYLQPVDLLDEEGVTRSAEQIAARFGRIDILIHLAGGWTGGKSLSELPRSDLEWMINQHIWSSFYALRAFIPHLVENGWGRMVMVSSPSAQHPAARGAAYAVGKAGQEALVMALARELTGSGVTANLLVVKMIDVQREKISAPSAENAGWTTPEELSAAAQYLFSEEGGAVNGARIPLYGG
jgi:NAD(P)-dependent dehydrogenase (short-subunit alcohol dehydrogenase family)